MIRVALRGIRSHFVRFLLAVLAVGLGVAFVAGTFSLRGLLADTFEGIVTGSADAQAYVRSTDKVAGIDDISGRTDVPAPLPMSLADDVAQAPGVDRAIPNVSGTLVLVGADGSAVATAGAPILAFPLEPDDPTLDLVAGAPPTDSSEIALETIALEQSGLAVGDSTHVVVGEDIRDVTVTAEFSFGASAAGAILVGLDPETAYADFAPDGLVPEIAAYATDGTSEDALRDSIAQHLSQTDAAVEVITGEAARDEVRASIDEMLGFIQVFLLVFAAVSLFVGGFLIANTFAMSVRERMREFALLRAIGAGPGQVFTSIVVQALVIGVIGSGVGIAAGIGLAAAIGAFLATIGMDLAGSVSLDPATVLISLAIGVAMSVIAAAIPARRAARTAPVVAMRGEVPNERGLKIRGAIGSALSLVGLIGVTLAAFVRSEDGSTLDQAGALLGLGALILMIGALILAPALARHVVTALAAPVVAFGKPLGALARGNVVRNPRRTASTAGALMIGMVLVSAASVLASSASSSLDSLVRSDLKADFLLQGSGPVPERAADQVDQLDSVANTQRTHFTIAYASGAQSPQVTVGISPTFFETAVAAKVFEGDLSTLASGLAAVDRHLAKDAGWHVGDSIDISSQAGGSQSTSVQIGAVITADSMNAGVYLPDDVYTQAITPASSELGALFVTAAPGATTDALRADLVRIVEPYYVITVADADDMSSLLAEQVNAMLAVVYALLGLSIVIAVLGIINTLALSVIERTREIALLRAVGLGRLQLAAMIGIESVLTAVFGTILGVAIGLGIASALPSVLADSGLDNLVIPWGQLAGMVALAAVVGVIASLWPASRAARMPVLSGLAAD